MLGRFWYYKDSGVKEEMVDVVCSWNGWDVYSIWMVSLLKVYVGAGFTLLKWGLGKQIVNIRIVSSGGTETW